MLYSSTGHLNYGSTKLVLLIDQGIVDFYRALIPKATRTNKQLYPAHISCIRKDGELKQERFSSKPYQDQEVEFAYDTYHYNDGVYWWLNAYSMTLEDIRLELGLPVNNEWTKSQVKPYLRRFHITLANTKGLTND